MEWAKFGKRRGLDISTTNQPARKRCMTHKLRFILVILSLTVLAACASTPPNKRAGVTVGTVYKFSNPRLDSSLYVKFLPAVKGKSGLLFAIFPNSKVVKDIKASESGVFKQDWYSVTDDGFVSFRCHEKDNYRKRLELLKYATAADQFRHDWSFWYRLNFKHAEIVRQ